MLSVGESNFAGEEHTHWLSNIKWPALKTYAVNIIQIELLELNIHPQTRACAPTNTHSFTKEQ